MTKTETKTMKFQTHNEIDIDTMGTSLEGEIDASYADIVKAFGEPEEGCDKTDAEWRLKFKDGTVATIYNYKTGTNYLGHAGTPLAEIRDWHIGSKKPGALQLVYEAFREAIPNPEPAPQEEDTSALGPHLTKREKATILAALRCWQRTGLDAIDPRTGDEFPEMDIASDGGTIEPCTAEQIDALCERINS